MLVTEKRGMLKDFTSKEREIDTVSLEWYETGKRILHKKSRGGVDVVLKFLNRSPEWMQDDVIHADDHKLVLIDITPCEVIRIKPRSVMETARICYEIGNKHLPLFHEGEDLLTPFDEPLYRLLYAGGYDPEKGTARLINSFRTNVLPHEHSGEGGSVFSRIMQLTKSIRNEE